MEQRNMDVLMALYKNNYQSQRAIANETGHALGMVNKALRTLVNEKYIDSHMRICPKTAALFDKSKPKNAVILAAGYGMRMVPINYEAPKALLKVNGETLIERQIRHLHDVGIHEIYVVVGFMKEQFEYLIDKYSVHLIVNSSYSTKNNMESLWLVRNHLGNTYIVPCDIWWDHNPFHEYELYSWYMVSDLIDDHSEVRINRRNELVKVQKGKSGNSMIGLCYLTQESAGLVRKKLDEYHNEPSHDHDFWETTLFQDGQMIVQARGVHASDFVEINTYEQLRDLDSESDQLKNDALDTIASVSHCDVSDICNINVLKKGMTNRSFIFSVNGQKYIMRIPGEGTDKLINRKQEADVYQAISRHGLCDDPVYINPENGYKITKFLNGVRECDPDNEEDISICMKKLRSFHDMNLQVDHVFDLFGHIDFYQSLWHGKESVFHDYETTKRHVFALKDCIEKTRKQWCLTHIDAVPDNFLFYQKEDGTEGLQLTDWEYGGMQDPHVDIAMFCIYSFYDKAHCDHLIDLYFNGTCTREIRRKIYCYIAVCGLLWSNWCEYKSQQGVEFGEYNLRQYRYAKEFYRYACEMEALQ